MGDDIRMDSAWWKGKNVDDRSRTNPIEWSMQFTRGLLSYYWMSDISTQLLLDKYDNEQPLERLLNSIYYIANLLFNTNLTILATILIIISNVIQGSRQNACREGVGNKQNSNYTHSIAARPKAGPINVAWMLPLILAYPHWSQYYTCRQRSRCRSGLCHR